MNRNIKMAWISALRSGEYEQALGFERCRGERVKHDPLGVLGELCEYESGAEIFKDMNSAEGRAAMAEFISDWTALCEWGEIPGEAQWGRGEDGELITKVIQMNDNGDSFEMIADEIEKTVGPGWEE